MTTEEKRSQEIPFEFDLYSDLDELYASLEKITQSFKNSGYDNIIEISKVKAKLFSGPMESSHIRVTIKNDRDTYYYKFFEGGNCYLETNPELHTFGNEPKTWERGLSNILVCLRNIYDFDITSKLTFSGTISIVTDKEP